MPANWTNWMLDAVLQLRRVERDGPTWPARSWRFQCVLEYLMNRSDGMPRDWSQYGKFQRKG